MIKEAEQFAEQDLRKKEEVEIRNNADSLIYTVEKTKKDLGEKISKENIERLDKAISELKEALRGKEVDTIKSKSEDLTKILQEVGAIVYQQTAQKRAQQPTEQKGKSEEVKEEKVVDADYKVVDEDDVK